MKTQKKRFFGRFHPVFRNPLQLRQRGTARCWIEVALPGRRERLRRSGVAAVRWPKTDQKGICTKIALGLFVYWYFDLDPLGWQFEDFVVQRGYGKTKENPPHNANCELHWFGIGVLSFDP